MTVNPPLAAKYGRDEDINLHIFHLTISSESWITQLAACALQKKLMRNIVAGWRTDSDICAVSKPLRINIVEFLNFDFNLAPFPP